MGSFAGITLYVFWLSILILFDTTVESHYVMTVIVQFHELGGFSVFFFFFSITQFQ